MELGRARARLLGEHPERRHADDELQRLLAVSPDTTILPVLGTPSAMPLDTTAGNLVPPPDTIRLNLDSLTMLALARRPDLAARAAAVRQAEAQVTVAGREVYPNLLLRASSEILETSGERVIRPGIGLTIPFFNWNRGVIQARRAQAAQAESNRSALLLNIRAEVAVAFEAYRIAAGEVAVLEQGDSRVWRNDGKRLPWLRAREGGRGFVCWSP